MRHRSQLAIKIAAVWQFEAIILTSHCKADFRGIKLSGIYFFIQQKNVINKKYVENVKKWCYNYEKREEMLNYV